MALPILYIAYYEFPLNGAPRVKANSSNSRNGCYPFCFQCHDNKCRQTTIPTTIPTTPTVEVIIQPNTKIPTYLSTMVGMSSAAIPELSEISRDDGISSSAITKKRITAEGIRIQYALDGNFQKFSKY
jgi:hypothetical protein